MPYVIVCAHCDEEAPNRGRGLCPRCYQWLWRHEQLPPPHGRWPNHGSSAAEVLNEDDDEY